MKSILLKRSLHPFFVVVISSLLVCVINWAVPHEFARTPGVRSFISAVSYFVPALKELVTLLPPEHIYIALTGAVVWGVTAVAGIVSQFSDYKSIVATKSYSSDLRQKKVKTVASFCGIILLSIAFCWLGLIKVWRHSTSSYHGRGSWMQMLDMADPNIIIQMVTWSYVGITAFLFFTLSAGIIVTVKYFFAAEVSCE